ncbi:hypothetical protein IMSAGC006_01139 [Muribaculaceae bacterium]|nr:hypothetical protein IMSAGC006_01139 [Muribaculaceae bacterium]
MDAEEELAALDAVVRAEPDNADAVYRRGRLLWKLGRCGAAITDFNTAAELDPSGPGREAAEHAMSIMSFFNPDLYNP